jgi:hypothetical protein
VYDIVQNMCSHEKGINISVVKPEGKRPLRNADKDGMILEIVPD